MQLSYKWTKEQFLDASKANYDLRLRALKFRLLGYFGLLFMVVGAYLSYAKSTHATLFISTILVFYWYVLRWPLYRLQLARHFKKHASKDKVIFWTIDADSFSIQSDSGGGKYSWAAVTDIAETGNGFLIRQYPVFYWLPKDSFESDNDIEWFRTNIVRKTGADQAGKLDKTCRVD